VAAWHKKKLTSFGGNIEWTCIEIESDGNERLLASGLTPGEVVRFWSGGVYTKPLGPGRKIWYREHAQTTLRMNTNGTGLELEPEPEPVYL
jgi:hypothetical protein